MKYTHLLLGISASVLYACSNEFADFISYDKTIITGNSCLFTNNQNDNLRTQLPSGSQVILNATGSLHLENQIFIYSGSIWESDSPVTWNDLSGTADIVALHPTYKDNLYNNLYSTGQLEDVLYIKDSFTAGQEINFQFKHLFSRLTFHISEDLQDKIKEIRLKAPLVNEIIPATAEIKFNTAESYTTTLTGNAAESYSFIVPPIENANLTVELITSQGSTVKALEPHSFASNHEYKCNIKTLDDQSNIGISSAEDLIAFSWLINNLSYSGKSLSDFGVTENGVTTYRLLNDIKLTDEESSRLKPIGMYSKNFSDTFDGQGFTIYNLTPSTYGLFGYTSANAMIKNLCIDGATPNQKTTSYAGALVGFNKGTILNCAVLNSTIKANTGAGGLAGLSSGIIINSSVHSCNVEATSSGGIAGEASGKIINSFSVKNTIKNTTGGSSGGIYGRGASSLLTATNCYVDCNSSNKAFGIITGGANLSKAEHCFYRSYNGINTGLDSDQMTETYSYNENFIAANGDSVLSSLNEWVTANALLHPEYELRHWTNGTDEIPAIFINE